LVEINDSLDNEGELCKRKFTMKLIAHRGNIDGPNPLEENRPEYIDAAIEAGFDVEVDVQYDALDKKLYLGHDGPQYQVDWSWFGRRMNNLWIHCKNLEALYEFSISTSAYDYFWHQEDDFALTSKNYIWTYPGRSHTSSSIIVMPETIIGGDIRSLKIYNCFGICSDYVGQLK
jgi:glycerophosphoryl diester phosphodiesterase